jgi:hypothetical protein
MREDKKIKFEKIKKTASALFETDRTSSQCRRRDIFSPGPGCPMTSALLNVKREAVFERVSFRVRFQQSGLAYAVTPRWMARVCGVSLRA